MFQSTNNSFLAEVLASLTSTIVLIFFLISCKQQGHCKQIIYQTLHQFIKAISYEACKCHFVKIQGFKSLLRQRNPTGPIQT